MFDIGFPELLIVALVLLLVVGPERLPEVLRTVGRVVGSARRSFDTLKAELEREVGADDLRRELHNARIMEDAKRLQEDLKGAEQSFKALEQTTKAELTAAEDALRAPPTVDPSSNEGEAEGEANAKAEAPKAEAEVYDWPTATRRKSGELVRSPRNIVDTGTLLRSQSAPRVQENRLTITWGAPYSGEVLRGGFLVGTLRDAYIAPGRDWITPVLRAEEPMRFFVQEWRKIGGA